MSDFDKIIHQPVRLRIMATLAALDAGDSVDFSFLRDHLKLTDGNLGAKLLDLENAGYLDIQKTFVGRRPKTFVKATASGRLAFETHRQRLFAMLTPPGKKGKA